MTNNRFILDIINGLKIPFVSLPSQNFKPNPIRCSWEEKLLIDNEISKYLQKGIVTETTHCSSEFVSQIFPRPKKSGGVRIILNLSKLNEGVKYEHFKMETLNSVLMLIRRNCFMGSIDLQDAYYSININPDYRKYLRFIWNSKLYEFTCLPNGLSCAPRVFTKILKPIYENLRKLGLISVYFLDDSWLMGNTFDDCQNNINKTANLLQNSGFIINEAKSIRVPTQSIQFLGFNLDSVQMIISLPQDKIENVTNLCNEILTLNRFKIRFLAKLIGVLVSSLPAVKNGELYYRYLELNRNNALKKCGGNFDGITSLDSEAREEVIWWLKNVGDAKKDLVEPEPSLVISTDASLLGWGAEFESNSTGGLWNSEESSLHINVLELKAIEFGLKSFLNKSHGQHIRIKSDNTTAIAYINNKGGVKSIPCHRVAKDIWEWAVTRNNHLSAQHLPGSENIIADRASRIHDVNTEWMLSNSVFSKIEESFGVREIDLFASRLNFKCKPYVSWKPDPDAFKVDAFLCKWSEYNFYAFPPFSMIAKTLMKIDTDGATGVLVCPIWPTQAWFPRLMSMLIDAPLILPRRVLSLPFRKDLATSEAFRTESFA